jgi:HEAT repeat protein
MTRFCILLLMMTFAAFAADDVITLNDGRTVAGKIIKEDADSVFIQQDGEQRGIAKSRIAKIERAARPADAKAPVAGNERPANKNEKPPLDEDAMRSQVVTAQQIRKLGSSDLDERTAAKVKILDGKNEMLPVMLAMLHPKADVDEYTRIGILRILVDFAPLTEQASKTLAFSAVNDPYAEARREACVTIRTLGDDIALRELIRYSSSEDMNMKKRCAIALREIDDQRLLASLIRAIPSPNVTANQGEVGGLSEPAYTLPTGPGGMNMPIYLPKQEVAGTATDIDSPAATLLKLIANKPLGNMQYGWFNWYREKLGDITAAERNAYKERRSARDRMGSPPSGSSSP